MKRTISFFALIFLAATLLAQNLFTVSGTVWDANHGGTSIPYAKVELFTTDNRAVGNTQCDADGNYLLQVPAGDYHLRVSTLGYYLTGRSLSLAKDLRLDTIRMYPEGPVSLLGTDIFPIKTLTIQEMYDINRGHFVTTLEGLYRAPRHAVSFRMDSYHPFDRNREVGILAVAGYTFHFKPRLGGWGIHAGWEGGQFGHYRKDVWNAGKIGVEYERFRPNGHLYHFRLLFRYSSLPAVPFQFSFDWDIPRLFGVKGLSFCGYLDIWGDEYYFAGEDGGAKGMIGSIRLEPQVWYNLSHRWSSRGVGHYMGREGLGVFFKLPINYYNPGGWHYGSTYYRNGYPNLTPCFGLRWDF